MDPEPFNTYAVLNAVCPTCLQRTARRGCNLRSFVQQQNEAAVDGLNANSNSWFVLLRRSGADGLDEGFSARLLGNLGAALSLSAASNAIECRLPIKFCASASGKLSYSELAEGISEAVG